MEIKTAIFRWFVCLVILIVLQAFVVVYKLTLLLFSKKGVDTLLKLQIMYSSRVLTETVLINLHATIG
jgi:hypothetical protein